MSLALCSMLFGLPLLVLKNHSKTLFAIKTAHQVGRLEDLGGLGRPLDPVGLVRRVAMPSSELVGYSRLGSDSRVGSNGGSGGSSGNLEVQVPSISSFILGGLLLPLSPGQGPFNFSSASFGTKAVVSTLTNVPVPAAASGIASSQTQPPTTTPTTTPTTSPTTTPTTTPTTATTQPTQPQSPVSTTTTLPVESAPVVAPAPAPAPAPVVATPASPSNSASGDATWYSQAPAGMCASPWLSMGTIVTVKDVATGASIECTVDDREASNPGRVVDLSYSGFSQLANPSQGVIFVSISW